MSGQNPPDPLHQLKNQLAIIIGFCDLLVEESAPDDPRRSDFLEIQRSAWAAMAVLPEIDRRATGE